MAGIDDRVASLPIHKSPDSDEVLEYYSQISPWYIKTLCEHFRNEFEKFGYDYFGHVQPLLSKAKQRKHFKT